MYEETKEPFLKKRDFLGRGPWTALCKFLLTWYEIGTYTKTFRGREMEGVKKVQSYHYIFNEWPLGIPMKIK